MSTRYPSIQVNPLDLSPNYAGTIMAITNGIGSLIGIAAPNGVGVLTPNVRRILLRVDEIHFKFLFRSLKQLTVEEWRVVFWIIYYDCFVDALGF